jgi:hypothetical protein
LAIFAASDARDRRGRIVGTRNYRQGPHPWTLPGSNTRRTTSRAVISPADSHGFGVNVPLLLELVAGVLAAYDLVDRRGRAPTSWAVLAIVLALVWGRA